MSNQLSTLSAKEEATLKVLASVAPAVFSLIFDNPPADGNEDEFEESSRMMMKRTAQWAAELADMGLEAANGTEIRLYNTN